MKNLLLYLALLLTVGISSSLFADQEIGKAIVLDKTVPIPPHREVLKNPSSDAAHLKSLLDEGKLRDFYLKADYFFTKMDTVKDEDFTEETLADRLWVYYYYVAAPTLPTDADKDLEWVRDHNDLDFNMKDSLGRFIGRHKPKLLAKRLSYRQQELAELLASYYAGVMKTLYANYDPWWKEKDKKLREEKDERKMSVEERTLWRNRMSRLNSRNNMVGHRLRFQEKDFMKFLMLCFPGKSAMIRKYISQAGYRDDEVEELIALTLGKNAQTEFLLKSLPNKSRKKPDADRPQAVPRDVAL